MGFVRALVRAVVGGVFGIVAAFALVPAFAAFRQPSDGPGIVWVVVLAGVVLSALAPTMRRAFGRGFLLAGCATLALPLSMLLLSGRVTADMLERQSDLPTAAGAGIAATMVTGAAAFVGFFLGAIFLVIGLVLALGGRREVVVVEREPRR